MTEVRNYHTDLKVQNCLLLDLKNRLPAASITSGVRRICTVHSTALSFVVVYCRVRNRKFKRPKYFGLLHLEYEGRYGLWFPCFCAKCSPLARHSLKLSKSLFGLWQYAVQNPLVDLGLRPQPVPVDNWQLELGLQWRPNGAHWTLPRLAVALFKLALAATALAVVATWHHCSFFHCSQLDSHDEMNISRQPQ